MDNIPQSPNYSPRSLNRLLLIIIILFFLIGGYFAFAKYESRWPWNMTKLSEHLIKDLCKKIGGLNDFSPALNASEDNKYFVRQYQGIFDAEKTYFDFNGKEIAECGGIPAPLELKSKACQEFLKKSVKFNTENLCGKFTSDKTVNWKTYSNFGLNFSVNYPNGFQLKEDNAISKLFSGTDGHFWVFIENNTKNLDAEGLMVDFYKNDGYGYQYQDSFMKVAGVNSYKQGRYDLGVIERYYIPKNGKIFRIEFEFNFNAPDQNSKESKISLISDILSTFKFTN